MTETPPPTEFHVEWDALPTLPLHFVNQFALQVGAQPGPGLPPEGIYLTVGSVAPPVLSGDQTAMHAQLSQMGGRLPVQPVARVLFSKERALDLIKLLGQAVEQYDAAAAVARGDSSGGGGGA